MMMCSTAGIGRVRTSPCPVADLAASCALGSADEPLLRAPHWTCMSLFTSSFSFAFGRTVADHLKGMSLAFALAGRPDREESACLRLVREVLANLAVVGQDGHHVLFVKLGLVDPVVRNKDSIGVVKAVDKFCEQVVVVAVGGGPKTAADEDLTIVFINSR